MSVVELATQTSGTVVGTAVETVVAVVTLPGTPSSEGLGIFNTGFVAGSGAGNTSNRLRVRAVTPAGVASGAVVPGLVATATVAGVANALTTYNTVGDTGVIANTAAALIALGVSALDANPAANAATLPNALQGPETNATYALTVLTVGGPLTTTQANLNSAVQSLSA